MKQQFVASRLATAVFFFLQGLCAATFVGRIPEFKSQLALTAAQLGLATGLMACGGLVMLPLAAMAVSRFGSRRILSLAALGHLSLLATLGYIERWAQLLFVLGCFGMANTAVQISVNAQAVLVERARKQSLLAQFHGLWSVAGLIAALLNAAAVATGASRGWHFTSVAAFGALCVVGFTPHLENSAAATPAAGTSVRSPWRKPERVLIRLALLTAGAMFCESAMFDFSGVYFSQLITAEPQWVSLSYSIFMASMAIGRLVADRFVGRLGIEGMLTLGGRLVGAGYLLGAAVPSFWPALLSFVLIGLGVCAMVPLIMGQTGRATKTPLATALAFVSVMGFVGAFLGPVFVGFVAQHIHLRVAFAGVGIVGVGISLRVGPNKTPSAPGAASDFMLAQRARQT